MPPSGSTGPPPWPRQSASHTPTLVADAQTLPLRDDSVDVVLCLHMLYHVLDINQAARELRRVVRPGGTAMVTTNGLGHTIEAKRILATAAHQVAGIDVDLEWDTHRFPPTYARDVLATVFDDIDVYEAGDTTDVSDPAVIADYLASWPPESVGLHTGPLWHQILAATRELLTDHFTNHRHFPITSRVAILRCR